LKKLFEDYKVKSWLFVNGATKANLLGGLCWFLKSKRRCSFGLKQLKFDCIATRKTEPKKIIAKATAIGRDSVCTDADGGLARIPRGAYGQLPLAPRLV